MSGFFSLCLFIWMVTPLGRDPFGPRFLTALGPPPCSEAPVLTQLGPRPCSEALGPHSPGPWCAHLCPEAPLRVRSCVLWNVMAFIPSVSRVCSWATTRRHSSSTIKQKPRSFVESEAQNGSAWSSRARSSCMRQAALWHRLTTNA